MTPTEERIAITIDAILGFYPTGDAERDRQSAAVIAKALLDDLDIERIEREAYERGRRMGMPDNDAEVIRYMVDTTANECIWYVNEGGRSRQEEALSNPPYGLTGEPGLYEVTVSVRKLRDLTASERDRLEGWEKGHE